MSERDGEREIEREIARGFNVGTGKDEIDKFSIISPTKYLLLHFKSNYLEELSIIRFEIQFLLAVGSFIFFNESFLCVEVE